MVTDTPRLGSPLVRVSEVLSASARSTVATSLSFTGLGAAGGRCCTCPTGCPGTVRPCGDWGTTCGAAAGVR